MKSSVEIIPNVLFLAGSFVGFIRHDAVSRTLLMMKPTKEPARKRN